MQDKLEMRTFILCLVLITIGFFWVLKPFFAAIFWSCAITVIFYPVNQRLLKKFNGRRNITALTTLLLCILIVIIPVIFVVSSVIAEGVSLYNKLQSGEVNPAVYIDRIRSAFPWLEHGLERFDIELDKIKDQATDAAIASGKFLAQHTFSIGQNAFGFIINMALMLYMTFFFLRDGEKLVDLMIRALPLGDARERQLFTKFAEVTRATIKGNLSRYPLQAGKYARVTAVQIRQRFSFHNRRGRLIYRRLIIDRRRFDRRMDGIFRQRR